MKYIYSSKALRKLPFLTEFLADLDHLGSTIVLGWGQRPTTVKARAYARKHGLPYVALEDGFLRSVDLGVNGAAPLSMVVDEIGIYYDARHPSKLEQLIAQTRAEDHELKRQAQTAQAYLVQHQLSKYNHAPAMALPALPADFTHRVLVVDQTRGDMSVVNGGGEDGVVAMLDAALHDHPTAQIIVKTHPDVLTGKKQGYLTDHPLLTHPRVLVWAKDCAPLPLLFQVDHVYVYTSQMGFEALMLDKPVHCFGLPWYAGWGVTRDRHPDHQLLQARRPTPKAVWQLFAAAYLQYVRYLHPDLGCAGTIMDVMPWLVRNRDAAQQLSGTLYCIGMSFWKQATVRPFLRAHTNRLVFVPSLAKLNRMTLAADAKLVTWGSRDLTQAQQLAQQKNIPLWRMEDGFVRSVGLGSDLFRPLSLVVDRSGMYYDPHSQSDLEQMLLQRQWTAAQEQHALDYITAFTQKGLSKYNLGGQSIQVTNQSKRIVLIPGQVEDDASVQYGSPVIQTNAQLITAVRQQCPDAYIIYKPHPDVVVGNRKGHVPPEVLAQQVDHVVVNTNIVECLRLADEVHTMTSLTGFEALLHGKVVHCYGGPFYAGWGLTQDHYALPHRQRKLSLAQLVYTTIFQYPRYSMPFKIGTNGFAAPESVLAWLSQHADQQKNSAAAPGWFNNKKRKATALWQLLRS